MSVQPPSSYASTRPPSVYPGGYRRVPKSVITFEFYDTPPQATNMSDPNAPQLVPQSPQKRPSRASRANSPKPVTRHQVGVKKHGGGGGVGGKVVTQRTSNASPAVARFKGASGYFTITAYLPFDGGKRLKVRRERERERKRIRTGGRDIGVAFLCTHTVVYICTLTPAGAYTCVHKWPITWCVDRRMRLANGCKRTCANTAKSVEAFRQVK